MVGDQRMRDDRDHIQRLFAAWEDLLTLRKRSDEYPVGLWITDDWHRLSRELDEATQAVDGLTRTMPLDPERLKQVFAALLGIKADWPQVIGWEQGNTQAAEWDTGCQALLESSIGTLRDLIIDTCTSGP